MKLVVLRQPSGKSLDGPVRVLRGARMVRLRRGMASHRS